MSTAETLRQARTIISRDGWSPHGHVSGWPISIRAAISLACGSTGIEQRIAGVVDRAQVFGGEQSLSSGNLADLLVAELGLRPDFMVRHESGGGCGFAEESDAREFVDNFAPRPPCVDDPGSGTYTRIEKRWVTRWEPA
jgi:hypothetical protein